MAWKLPLFKVYWDEEDIEAVSDVIRRGSYWAIGEEIEQFEKLVADYTGTKYCLAFNSGTSALHTLLLCHEVQGKEVIVPSFTFIATANAVVLAGAKPVFAETEAETFSLDAADVEKRITKDTAAIMTIHYGGFPARDIVKLRKIADKHKILLIEDAAESFGATIGDKKVGSFGHSAIFSLCQGKVFTTGEGGMIVTDSKDVYEKAKLLRSHGRVEKAEDYFSSTGDNDYIRVGFNFRMPTMIAALGISQFKKVSHLIELRRKNAHFLTKRLSKIKEVTCPKELKGHFQVYQMYTIQLPDEKTRDGLQKHLSDQGIMSKVYFNPVHLKTIYVEEFGCKVGDLPRTEELSKKVLNIPLYATMREDELELLAHSIESFFK